MQKITQFKLSKITLQSLSKFDISPTAKIVLLYLTNCYNPAKKHIYPKQETIAEKTGISLSSVKRAIKELSKGGLIIAELKFSNLYSFTQHFFNLINMTPDTAQNELPKCQNETNHVRTEKEPDKKQNNNLKNILELSKVDTIAYYEQTLNLSGEEKEHLLKIKLGRTNLTDFQKINLDKFIMLSESEINIIYKKEPYHRQENIDIYYNDRLKKIRKFLEESSIKKAHAG